jgi:hypothetical protein
MIMFKRKNLATKEDIAEVHRVLQLQGETLATILNQLAESQELIRKEAHGLHKRINFDRVYKS